MIKFCLNGSPHLHTQGQPDQPCGVLRKGWHKLGYDQRRSLSRGSVLVSTNFEMSSSWWHASVFSCIRKYPDPRCKSTDFLSQSGVVPNCQ